MLESVDEGVVAFHNTVCESLDEALTPPREEDAHTSTYIVKSLKAGLLFPTACCTAAMMAARHGIRVVFVSPEVKAPFERTWEDSRVWEEIDVTDCELPPDILKGVATCDYQYLGLEGAPHSQWAEFEKKVLDESVRSHTLPKCWEPDTIIHLLQKLHVNSFRFSVEWSNIEPNPGEWNEVEVQRYVTLCQKLREAGIEPLVTLHHFSNPHWFDFEDPANIPHFVNFSEKIFRELNPYVTYWNTINEPGVYVFMGYVLGKFPPQNLSLNLAGVVLRNMLQAHCDVYERLKAMNPEAQIGIAHQALKFKPYWSWNPIDTVMCHYLTRMTHETIMRFFETGVYEWKFPFASNIFWEKRNVQAFSDFFAVQGYVRPLSWFGIPTHNPGEEMTQMPLREDPVAIFEVAKECSDRLNMPILITETGISPRSDEQRKRFLERNVYAISQLPKYGVDLKGVFFWSLYKNFEWDRGMDPQDFGLLHFDEETQDFKLHYGAEVVAEAFENHQKQKLA